MGFRWAVVYLGLQQGLSLQAAEGGAGWVLLSELCSPLKTSFETLPCVASQCLIDGGDEYLQLLDVASNTMRALCNMPQESTYV